MDGYGDQIPYIPWHSGTVILNASYRKWDFNYSLSIRESDICSGNNTPVNYIQPWYTHDMSLSRNFPFKHAQLRITAEVK